MTKSKKLMDILTDDSGRLFLSGFRQKSFFLSKLKKIKIQSHALVSNKFLLVPVVRTSAIHTVHIIDEKTFFQKVNDILIFFYFYRAPGSVQVLNPDPQFAILIRNPYGSGSTS
jgi:hypothetical protein